MTDRAPPPCVSRVFRLARYADGVPAENVFEPGEEALAAPQAGQVLVRTLYLGMDPFPRLQIAGPGGRAPQLPLGAVMVGRGVGQVLASRDPALPAGTVVAGEIGWRDHAVVQGEAMKRVDPALGPVRHSLGVLGPSGLAAWCSLKAVGKLKPGETVLVSAAAGAVGSIIVQLAKAEGCRVVGVGGGDRQRAYLEGELGVAMVDYLEPDGLVAAIAEAAPGGVDLFMDLVAGAVFDAGLRSLATHGRAVLVGTVADYNNAANAPDLGPRPNLGLILKRATIQGFLVGDHAGRYDEALEALSAALASGALKVQERIVEGLQATPRAFAGLFGSDFVGKQIVRVAEPAGLRA